MILVVDDEAENRDSLCALLKREGFECLQAASASEGLKILREEPKVQLLITDLKMPGEMDGLDLLQAARLARPDVHRLLVTAYGTIEETVRAMKSGAFDVLAKPLKIKALKELIATRIQKSSTQAGPVAIHQFSPAYLRVTDTLRKAALSQATVLLSGESGCGKSYFARALHDWSSRRDGPFVPLNCAAIPSELIESELFGFEKGAFTGATQSRDGKIQAADKGTLLLDEISDLSLPVQAKLLQFIQDRQFFKLGSNRAARADVRIIAATNKNLSTMVEQGLFRSDLYFRLKVIEVHIPPLRERKQDLFWLIPLLMDSISEKNNMQKLRLSPRALSALYQYDWPGNVRELENVLEGAQVLAPAEEVHEGFLSEHSLPEDFRTRLNSAPHSASQLPQQGFTVSDLASIERATIEQALALTGGNKRVSAQLLGISERTLYRILGEAKGEAKV